MKKITRKSDQYYDDKLVHDVARLVYERLREKLEREGVTIGLPHYEELFKKYDGEKQIRQYLEQLEKDNKKNR